MGRPLTMQCPYPPQHETNRKFLCKGDQRNNCTDMVTSQTSGQTDLRFTLQDDVSSSSFSVTITELKADDAGTYWCGSDSQWSPGNYTKIQLLVVFLISTVETVRSQSTHVSGKQIKDPSLFHSVVFIVPAVLLAVLVFALVILCKYKCYKEQGGGVNMNRNRTKAADAEEAMGGADIYENQEVVTHSKQVSSKQQSACHQNDDTGGDQQDSVYQNFDITDDIYCNE
ncbi:CMRF35-like molecule 7 [Lates calcarifer]|uniref:CMRF35-like molecule 7 n=1 Tax=Lates calcarifer TaxID=8187 RepID=A0AAJ8B056_LATCA|nr:CMRF35-like molecule 7 [Lates calcarifer]